MHFRALQTSCLALVIAVTAIGGAAAATQPRPPAGFTSPAWIKAIEARHKAMARLGEASQLSSTRRFTIPGDGRRSDLNYGTVSGNTANPGDGRRSDLNYGTVSGNSATRPVIEIVAPGGFHWADAGVGVGAALAAVLLALGATVLLRNSRLTKA